MASKSRVTFIKENFFEYFVYPIDGPVMSLSANAIIIYILEYCDWPGLPEALIVMLAIKVSVSIRAELSIRINML
jgi:hypothetical protein